MNVVGQVKNAIAAGNPIWLRTYAGAWGVRDIALGKDGKSVKVLLGRQRNWTWLAYGQLEQLASQLDIEWQMRYGEQETPEVARYLGYAEKEN
jgi:hypothetical protein